MIPFYEIQPSDINIIRNERELSYSSHLHRHIEIVYIHKGIQHMCIGNEKYALNKGDAAVIFPNINHHYYREDPNSTGEGSASEVILTCAPKLFGSIFTDFSEYVPESPVIRCENISPDAVFAFEHLDENEKFTANLGYIYVILTRILENLTLSKTKHIPVEDITARIIEYINNNYTRPLTLDSVAAEFHISKYYLSHIFSKKIKTNFRKYIGALRAEYAASLLRATDNSMTDISYTAGFDSLRSFNRIFFAIYNMSPREYRRNLSTYFQSK